MAGKGQSPDTLNSLPTASATPARFLHGHLKAGLSLCVVQALSLGVWISSALLCFLLSLVCRQVSGIQSDLKLGAGGSSMTVGGVPGGWDAGHGL